MKSESGLDNSPHVEETCWNFMWKYISGKKIKKDTNQNQPDKQLNKFIPS